ncbi:MAG: hypothetical protein ACK5QX_10495 [bacterium]|jgi:hypothetical protein
MIDDKRTSECVILHIEVDVEYPEGMHLGVVLSGLQNNAKIAITELDDDRVQITANRITAVEHFVTGEILEDYQWKKKKESPR